jgi:hypothetical protein
MKLSIIAYNKLNAFRKLIQVLTLVLFALLIFLTKNKFVTNPTIVLSTLLIWVIAYIIIYSLPHYNKIGTIILESDGKCIIIIENVTNNISISNLTFYYGGYNGAEYPLWYLPAIILRLRSGTQNSLLINNKAYRILLNNKAEWNSLSSTINKIKSAGVKSEYIKMSLLEVNKLKRNFNI